MLNLIKEYPQGIMQVQLAHDLNTSKSNIHDAILRLLKKNYIEKINKGVFKLIKITSLGTEILKVDTAISNKATQAFTPLTQPAQRMHAIQLHTKLYRTSYGKAEQILTLLNIPFRKTSIKPPQYIIEWQGIKLKLTTRKLIAYSKELTAPLELEGSQLRSIAFIDTIKIVEDFLSKTNLRCQRDIEGHLIASLPYWEIAFTNNEIARKLTEKGGFIPIGYDRNTGNATIWADKSFSKELETNQELAHVELRKFGQGIQDGIIKPYDDEMMTRKNINLIMQNLLSFQEQYKKDREGDAVFRRDIQMHLRVMRKIDEKLSQRKLNEFV